MLPPAAMASGRQLLAELGGQVDAIRAGGVDLYIGAGLSAGAALKLAQIVSRPPESMAGFQPPMVDSGGSIS